MARRTAKASVPVANTELSRDVYGFTVRPNLLQRYKEYAVIYKEEEAERSARWERFLTTYSESAPSSAKYLSGVGRTVPEEKSQAVNEEEVGVAKRSNDGLRKFETWGQIRASLWPVERALCTRFKKGSHPSTNDDGSVQSAGSGDESEEEFYDVERSDTVGSPEVVNETSISAHNDDEPCPWKEELDALVRGGVPMALRGELWQVFVGTRTRRMQGHYQALLTLLADGGGDSDGVGGLCSSTSSNYSLSESGILEKWTSQIEKDLPRTFPGHPALDEDGRNALRHLLTAYARHNPDVGYCQAMNFFAALLLLMMPEENAFWTLAGIIDNYFEGYYSEKMLESQVDQLVLDDLVRKHFPRLVTHLDALGVQVAWVSGPWFLSIFVNMLPWESVLRVWDVLLYEGNRSMLFRTALALIELHGSAIMATKDAGDAVAMLQSLAGSTFDSSQLVLIACMGYQSVDELTLQELRLKHRPQVLAALSERALERSAWRGANGSIPPKSYNSDNSRDAISQQSKKTDGISQASDEVCAADSFLHNGEAPSSSTGELVLKRNLQDGVLDEEEPCVADLVEQVKWLKAELSRALEESRAATLRAEELETAFMELVKEDNRRLLAAKLEGLEANVAQLRKALADKEEQEQAMVQVMLRMEHEQRLTEDARRYAEEDAAAQRHAANVLQAKYEDALITITEMEKRTVMAESMLEATLQYQALDNVPVASPKRGIDPATRREEVSRWSWQRIPSKTVDSEDPSTASIRTFDASNLNGADLTKEQLKSKPTESLLPDSPQQQGLLPRRFSLAWREKPKGKISAHDFQTIISPAQGLEHHGEFSSMSMSSHESLDGSQVSPPCDNDSGVNMDTLIGADLGDSVESFSNMGTGAKRDLTTA